MPRIHPGDQPLEPTSFRLSLPATPSSVSVVRHLFGGVGDLWPVSELLMHDIQIAVSEACTNVVKHAHQGGAPGMVEVEAGLDGGAIVVRVRDNGPGLPDPGSEPAASSADGLGVGLALIGALSSRVTFGRARDGAHEVAMTFDPAELDRGEAPA